MLAALLSQTVLPTQATFAAQRAAKSAPPVVLSVAGFGYDAAAQLPREGLQTFEQKTGIQVEFIPAWGNSTEQLSLTRRALNGHFSHPDIYLMDVLWPAALSHHLLDLTPYLHSDEDRHEQLSELVTNDTVNGRLVALPFYLNLGMLYCRTDLLKKYGYKHPPGTWDEMERMAARIQKGERAAGRPNFWGYVFQGAAYEGLTCNALEWQASFGGGHIVEPDGKVSIKNPRVAQALRMAAHWIGAISPPSVLYYTESDSLNAFRSGNAAFLRYWSTGYNRIAGSSAIRGHIEAVPLPAGPAGGADTIGGYQLAVSAYSEHPHEAAQLVSYLAGSDVQKSRAIQEGYLPTLPRLYDDPELLHSVPIAKVVKEAKPEDWVLRPSTVAGDCYTEVSRIYYEGVHAVLSRQRSVDDVLASMDEQLQRLAARFHLPRR